MVSGLDLFDNIVLVIYFCAILVIGLYTVKSKQHTTEDYFLAGRNLGWVAIGLSIFATNISTAHFVGLIAAGSERGLCVGQFEWLAVFILIFLGWFIAPVLIKTKTLTMPQFFGERFNNKIRTIIAVISIVFYFITKISVTILAGGFILSEVLELNVLNATILIILITGVYTVIGGMRSVVNTQIVQSVLLLLAAFLLTFFGISEIGGIEQFFAKIPGSYLDITKPLSDPQYPWLGIILGAPIIGIWYWCTDQYIMQRILSAKNIKQARKGTLLTAFLKSLPIFFIIIPGLIASILYPESNGNFALSNLINGSFIPSGIKGLILVGIISALMSSLASSFNSAAALFTNDIYKLIKQKASEHELVLVGRLSTTIIILITISIIPIVKVMDIQIYFSLQEIQAYLSPPITSIFLFGIFWKGANSKGVMWTLFIGGLIGLIKLIAPYIIPADSFISPIFIEFNNINYLYFSFVLFVISSVILVTVSKLTNNIKVSNLIKDYTFSLQSVGLEYSHYKTPIIGSLTFVLILILLEILI
ncbi:MAG: sodium/solute symporter [Melioribacteraceae bacterium]|nr:sodium/solute symporter [Melioribacteraceae bacterium]